MTYLDDLADRIRQEVPEHALPDGDTSGLFRLYAVLLLAKGQEVTGADVHNAWVAWMAGQNGSHESLVPYENLAPEVQAEDSPYAQAIRVVARQPGGAGGRT